MLRRKMIAADAVICWWHHRKRQWVAMTALGQSRSLPLAGPGLIFSGGQWMEAMSDAVGPGDLVLCVNAAPNHVAGKQVPLALGVNQILGGTETGKSLGNLADGYHAMTKGLKKGENA